jgi:hypothetical protein
MDVSVVDLIQHNFLRNYKSTIFCVYYTALPLIRPGAVGGFLLALWFSPPIKLTVMIKLKYC